MKINEAGLSLIKSFEGCRLQSYRDIVGILTVGYGHTGADVSDGMTIDQATADALLEADLAKFEEGISDIVVVPLNDNQFSSLVCFAYNLGIHALAGSHLLAKVNMNNLSGAADEFLKWDRAGGQVVPGLLRRRTAERNLFLSSL